MYVCMSVTLLVPADPCATGKREGEVRSTVVNTAICAPVYIFHVVVDGARRAWAFARYS